MKKSFTKSLDISNAFIHTYIYIYMKYGIRNMKYMRVYACVCGYDKKKMGISDTD